MKTPHSISSALAAAILTVAAVMSSSTATAALTVVNGDFENVTGLSGALPWYMGVPAGWNGLGNNYSVGTDGISTVGNLEQLSSISGSFQPLYQDLGTLDATSTVTLTFSILQPWNGNPIEVGAAIWPGATLTGQLGALPQITSPGVETLTVTDVPAGTAIRIGFWRVAGSPGLDNVSVTMTPVPESSSAALAGLASAVLLGSRCRRSGGTTAPNLG